MSYFLNFTNHPSDQWGEEQRKAAEVYGDIQDMPFPIIDPHATARDIDALAETYRENILSMGSAQELTAHIMGEQTFCFALIHKLQQAGVRCVASCTERDTYMNEQGAKVSTFHFTQFREYVSSI